jgi:hypothetical protein
MHPCAGDYLGIRCEVYINRRYCGRRVVVLYSGDELFACRNLLLFALLTAVIRSAARKT